MLLTLAEVARRLGVSEKMARNLARNLPSVRVGKRNRYPADAVAEFVNSARTPSVESESANASK